MSFVSESRQAQWLAKHRVLIRTEFWDDSRIRVRTSDNSYKDDIHNGIILKKTYYRDKCLIHEEKEFSPNIIYTYIGSGLLHDNITCPNCGFVSTGADYINSCPYCGASFNMEYRERQEGGQLSASRSIKNYWYYPITLILCLAICLPISSLLIGSRNRTFLFFDKVKILFFAAVPALVLFFGLYVLNIFVTSRRAERRYEEQTIRMRKFQRDLWLHNIPISTFFNNLHSELERLFYKDSEKAKIIDFDILEFSDFQIKETVNGRQEICLTTHLRIILLRKNKLISRKKRMKITLRENSVIPSELHPGINIMICHNCGAAIDVTQDKCEYCGTRINYRQRLYMIEPELH